MIFCLQIKHKGFLQVGCITLGVHSQACPKYGKQQFCNISRISQEKHERWSWFFSCKWTSKVSSNWYYRFRCVWPDMPKFSKITNLLFLCNIAREKWVMIFLHIDKHESLLQIDTMNLMVMIKHSQSFRNSNFAVSLQYLKKEVRDDVDFLHADKHQSFLQVGFNNLSFKVSYKLILSLLMGVIKHSQSSQSNKFSISL